MEIKINNELSEHIENFTINSINLIDLIRPVGSLYWSANNIDPSTIYPGTTWQAITDTWVVAAGSTYKAGTAYGAETHTHTSAAHTHTVASHTHTTGNHTLTVDEMPSHQHTLKTRLDATGFAYFPQATRGNNAGTVEDASPNIVNNTGGSQPHNHGNTGGTSLTTNSTTPGNTGSASNIPPSVAKYCWQRIS